VRASAQLISYELSMTLSVLPVFLWVNAPGGSGTLSLFDVVQSQSQPGLWGGAWYAFLMPVSAFIFLVALFAETNRQPFDMPNPRPISSVGSTPSTGPSSGRSVFVAEYCHMMSVPASSCSSSSAAGIRCRGCRCQTVIEAIGLADDPAVAAGALAVGIFIGKVVFFIFFFMWVRWTLPAFPL
jgi:NADH-quinone oxidoreductase subunit H